MSMVNRLKMIYLVGLIVGAILPVFGSLPLNASSEVKVWEESLVIPTYLTGKPEKFPLFYSGRAYQGAKGPVYPYSMLDELTDVRENKTYKALFLENDYVRICVLPEIGGRIFSALDKTNNCDFFYRQHVIKPALIGMLGAWISGGVEWNFPHHHRATAFMPVDYTLTENPDGSKTIWVGELEIRHRTKWIIGLTLYPDRSYLEATVKLFNRTPFVHSMLYWANVAVHASEDYQIIFPPSTECATFHGKNQFSHWPISTEVFNRVDYTSGIDVSWYRNHKAPTSFFAWNSKEDFFAGYDHGKEAGVAYVADHHIAPGKKFWTWGTGTQGQIWEKILTDTDGPYLELMVGAYSDNQPDYSWIQPYEAKEVKQYWFPLRKIRGVKNANLEAAVNLEVNSEGEAQIGINTTSVQEEAKVVLEAKGSAVFVRIINTAPDAPYFEEIKLPLHVKEQHLRLILYSSSGKELIRYMPVKRKTRALPEAVKPPPPPEEMETVESLYHAGLRLEQFHNPAMEAYPYYEEALNRDPHHSLVNTALGILFLKRGMFCLAEQTLERALSRITKNYTRSKEGEAFYYLGLALRAQNKFKEAYDAFNQAAWSYAWRASSYYCLAELDCVKGDYVSALNYLDRSLNFNRLNLRAWNLKASLLRRMGEVEKARQISNKVLCLDPLNVWAANEQVLQMSGKGKQNQADERLNMLMIQMGDEVQNYLELAIDYGNCGLWDEAVDVLSRLANSSDKEASLFPIVSYYLGYYLDQKGKERDSLRYYRKASQMPPDYCFPFRQESIDVFKQAIQKNPEDARAPYYFGNLLFDLQPEKAIAQWERAVALDNSFALVHRNLGLAYARVANDIPRAIKYLEKAQKLDKTEPRIYYELDQLYEAGGVAPEKRLNLLEENHQVVKQRDDALSREIILLVQLGRYDKALELLQNHHFHVWEGGGRIHTVYVDAHLLRGWQHFLAKDYEKSLEDYLDAVKYPENLEVGKPVRGGGEPRVYYFVGTAYEAMGEKNKAKECFEQSVSVKAGWSELSFYQGLSFGKLGLKDEEREMFEGLREFAQKRLQAVESMDFFAKFGERQSAAARRSQAHYLLGLSFLGKGEKERAGTEFKKACELNINHLWAKHYLSFLDIQW
jgi:tetratricopeptide (TPR) repeat protein